MRLLIISLLLYPIMAHAEAYSMKPWEDGYSDTFFSRSYNPEWDQAYARISYSTNTGAKMVVFSLVPREENENCRLSYGNQATDIIFTINRQAIKGGVRCAKYADTGNTYYAFWPYTEAGTDYITRTLKSASSKVLISSPLVDFYLSPIGFTREWNSSGQDAI